MGYSYAIVSALYHPHTGGVENFTRHLAHELVLQGNTATVITSRLSEDEPEVEEQDDGVRVYRLPSRVLLGGRLPLVRKNRRYRELFSELAGLPFDRVLVNTRFYPLSIEGLRLARRLGAEAVVLDHGSAYLSLGTPCIDACIRGYEHAMTAKARSFHPVFAGISRKSCAWLATFGIRTAHVIPNAIDAHKFRNCASHRDFRAEFSIGAETKLIAFVGRLAPEKGAEQLADAAALLGDGYAFLFAGEGHLRRSIEKKGLSNVVLLGNVSRGDVSALLSQSDALCLPTRSEGFCTALLEARAWNLPCVVTDVGGVDEIFGNGSPAAFILASTSPADIAEKLDEAAHASAPIPSSMHETRCSWRDTVTGVERAFACSPE